MLAYVFWHEPDPGVEAAAYERRLGAFHAALRGSPPTGFDASAAYRVPAVPWLPGPAYEDWYLVEDWSALGRLEEAAVSGARRGPHDEVASLAGNGTGGVYGGVLAGPEPLAVGSALWFGKPRGVPYPEFRARLDSALPRDTPIWQRRLTLGPAPEYCVSGERDALRFAASRLGADASGLVERVRVWP